MMRRITGRTSIAGMALLIGALFVIRIATTPAVSAVFGPDDRTAVPPDLKRHQNALGVLFNIRSRSVCTAFCVAEQLVVTAGHCLFKTRGEIAPRLEDFWFARNYDEVRDYARIAGHATKSAAQHVVAGSNSLSVAPPIDATSDWAIIRLSKPICSKGIIDVQPMTTPDIIAASNANKIFQLAYHRDFKLWRPAWSKPCLVGKDKLGKDFDGASWAGIAADFSKSEALLLHTCDTGGASSGSPLLIETAHGPKAVGINVGTYVQSKVIMSGGQTVQRMKPETVANTGVSALAFHDALTALKAATILPTTAALKDLQGTLAKIGHYKGQIDGQYGAELKAALVAFEVAEKLPATGIASEAILLRARAVSKR